MVLPDLTAQSFSECGCHKCGACTPSHRITTRKVMRLIMMIYKIEWAGNEREIILKIRNHLKSPEYFQFSSIHASTPFAMRMREISFHSFGHSFDCLIKPHSINWIEWLRGVRKALLIWVKTIWMRRRTTDISNIVNTINCDGRSNRQQTNITYLKCLGAEIILHMINKRQRRRRHVCDASASASASAPTTYLQCLSSLFCHRIFPLAPPPPFVYFVLWLWCVRTGAHHRRTRYAWNV